MCSKHKSYKAMRKPRANCLQCWTMWLKEHPEETVKSKELLFVLKSFMNEIKQDSK